MRYFGFGAIVFMIVPALFASAAGKAVVLTYGFSITLSAYSYIVETQSGYRESKFRSDVFFLVANPTLVCTRSGRQIGLASVNSEGCLRLLRGLVCVALGVGIVVWYQHSSWWQALAEGFNKFTGYVVAALVTYTVTYIGHSCAASVQTGWMLLLGWRVPERYRWAFLASHPLDFWRRWNTYVAEWLTRYVFYPTTLAVPRGLRAFVSVASVALIATFIVSGALHDFAIYVEASELHVGALVGFALMAVTILLIDATGRFFSRTSLRIFRALGRALGVLLTTTLLAVLHWCITTPTPELFRTIGDLVAL